MTTPATINTIDDICQLLDANPELAAALSQRLRGPEQAAIQEQLNQATALAAATAQTTADNSQLIAALGGKIDRLAETTAENSRLIQEIGVKQDRNAAQIAENSRFMAQLSAKVDRNADQIAELRQTTAENSRHIAELRQTTAENSQQITALGVKVDHLAETTAENSRLIHEIGVKQDRSAELIAENGRQIAALKTTTENQNARMGRIEGDAGKLKALVTEAQADDIMLGIAYKLDWHNPVRIHKADLIQLVHNQGINRDIRLSFIEADLVFRAQDPQGETTYCAIEISWTINQWDLNRANRNAKLLRQITNCPALAGVYGDRYEWRLDWTDVQWLPKHPDQPVTEL